LSKTKYFQVLLQQVHIALSPAGLPGTCPTAILKCAVNNDSLQLIELGGLPFILQLGIKALIWQMLCTVSMRVALPESSGTAHVLNIKPVRVFRIQAQGGIFFKDICLPALFCIF